MLYIISVTVHLVHMLTCPLIALVHLQVVALSLNYLGLELRSATANDHIRTDRSRDLRKILTVRIESVCRIGVQMFANELPLSFDCPWRLPYRVSDFTKVPKG